VTDARPRARATRRSSAEIRRLLLDAARELFERQGYQATTTQQIVDTARVDAPTLYRHFSSKADLFEATTLGELQDFLARFFADWRAAPPGPADPDQLIGRFVAEFAEVIAAHRESIRLLLTASEDTGELGVLARKVAGQLSEGLVLIREILVDEARAQGYQGINEPDVTIAAATGMVLSMVLFEDWVFPAGPRPSAARRVEELTALIRYGIGHRPTG
jgi:AcrR family transcriptional regulator